MDDDDFQIKWKQYSSNFITYEIHPGIYSMKVISDAVFTMGDYPGTLQIECADISMKTKFNLRRFGWTVGTLKFGEKLVFNKLLGFAPYWVYKATNAILADFRAAYTSENFLNLGSIIIIHLKCDATDGSVVKGLEQQYYTVSY